MSDSDYQELDPFRKVYCQADGCENMVAENETMDCEVCGKKVCPACAETNLIYIETDGAYVCKKGTCLDEWLEEVE